MSMYGRRATEICERQALREWLEARSAQRLRDMAVGMSKTPGFKVTRVATIDWLLEFRFNEVRRQMDADAVPEG